VRTDNPYDICRRIKRHHEKNGYPLKRIELPCDDAFVDKLVKNGVIELHALYEGGPQVCVMLTDKGLRMAKEGR